MVAGVKHKKTNVVPAWTQTDLDNYIATGNGGLPPVGTPISGFTTSGDWNDDHVITGLGQANGIATLNSSGMVPPEQLPSYVHAIMNYANLAAFPATGTADIIYIADDANKTYRWTGSAYIEVSPSSVASVFGRQGVVSAQSGDYTTAIVADSTNKRYVTDAQLVVIGNTSGTNTGDQTSVSGNSGTVTTINGRLAAGTNTTVSGAGTAASPYQVNANAGTVTGTGTTNYLTKWSSTTALTTGALYDDGTNVGIGTNSPNEFGNTGSILTIKTTASNGLAVIELDGSQSINSNGSGAFGFLNKGVPVGVFQMLRDGADNSSAFDIQIANAGSLFSGLRISHLGYPTFSALSSGSTAPTPSGTTKTVITDSNGLLSFIPTTSGTVTAVSVASANGFAGSSSGGATPALTLSTSVTGLLKGNGTAISAAAAGTDYQAPITLTTIGTSGAATLAANTLNIPQYASGGTTYVNTTKVDQTPASGTYGTLAGTVNGTNALFTVSNGAYVAGTLTAYLNGQLQQLGTDFTESAPASGTFTFAIAPPSGSVVNAEYITTASSTFTAGNAITVLSTTTGINGKTIANTALYTVPAGKIAVITGYTVRCSAASAITNGPAAGIGNISGTNNIAASQAMNALLTTSDDFLWSIFGMSKTTPAGGIIYYNQGTAATGTSQTLVVELWGYLV